MFKLIVPAIASLALIASPALADPTVIVSLPEAAPVPEADGVLGAGAPAAQLGVGEEGISTETMIHIGGAIFVVAAAAAVLGGGGGGGSDPAPATGSTN